LKLVERGSFREVALPADMDSDDVAVGVVFTVDGEGWRVAGIVRHPNRPGDHLGFVERVVAAQED
jgi:hypothetical protein